MPDERPPRDMEKTLEQLRRGAAQAQAVVTHVMHPAPLAFPKVHTPMHELADLADAGKASVICKTLLEQFDQVDAGLDATKEVAIALTHFGYAMTVHVHGLEYSDPHLIFLIGENDDGEPVRMVQNVSTLNFAIVTRPRLHPEEPKREFGFAQAVPRTRSGATVQDAESPPAP